MSELRCSLPLYILDNRLYDEAHAATLATRRLLLGSRDVDGGSAVDTHGDNEDDEEDLELPTYLDHVRDRVANAYLPETATMRVTNPWVAQGVSPVIHGHRHQSTLSNGSSGMISPAPIEMFPHHGVHDRSPLNQLPAVPSSDSQQLHWVTTELLMSLSDQPETRVPRQSPTDNSSPEAESSSRQGSRFQSHRGSRANSRAVSPERTSAESSRPSLSSASTNSNLLYDKTYVHNHNPASRNMHGLFHMSMKPFTSLSRELGLAHRTASGSNLVGMAPGHGPSGLSNVNSASDAYPSCSSSPSSGFNTPQIPRNATEDQILLHRAFIETPDYEIASRGFLGGGIPPLSSFAGLPSYEEASAGRGQRHVQRRVSDTDLTARMEQAHIASPHGHHDGHQGQAGLAAGTATAPPSPPRRTGSPVEL